MSEKFTVMRFFGDHMILQSAAENRVYGKSPSDARITLTISGGTGETVLYAFSDESGEYEIIIPPYPASFDSFTLTFSCCGEKIVFSDVLFGELYHISGQSNMELPISRTIDPLDPRIPEGSRFIREFRVPIQCCFGRNEVYDDFRGGQWKYAQDDALMDMSAAGYYFAEKLYNKLNVPVGLVNTSAGGSPVEARMPYGMLMELGGYEEFLSRCTASDYEKNTAAADREKYDKWCAELESRDTVSKDIFTAPHEYTKCNFPFYFRDDPNLSDFCGLIWFRKKFFIPDDMDMSEAVLVLGAMIDADEAFVNGVSVGSTGYMYPPRIYPVPKEVLRRGENILHIRLEVRQGRGGFVKGKKYCMKLVDKLIDLSGEWEYAVAARGEYITPDVFFQGLPLSMYGALTAPAFRIRFRGLIWYQGESNDNAPERYYDLFRTFVDMYRERCGYEIPVIFTQLCNFDDPVRCVPPLSWAKIREQQRKCLDIPKTAMAVTIDIGESNDLHPINKRDVGRRLALCAERLIYNDKSVPDDITCLSARNIMQGRVLLTFSDNASLRMKNDPAKHFELVFADGSIIVPQAEKTDIGIILKHSGPSMPVAVHYAYSNDPYDPDLYDRAGLPLSPFKVDIMRQVTIKEMFLDNRIYTKIYQSDSRGNNCAVILSHGYNCSHDDVEDIARSLAERGYFACTFDFCGGSVRSKSVGKSVDMSVGSELCELDRVIEFVRTSSGAEKLFLYGESQGGFVSALAACRNNIDGMVLLYPAFCIPDDWRNNPLTELKDPFDFMGMIISKNYYNGLPEYDVFDKISGCDIPVLIIHGTDDRIVNVSYAKKAADSFPNASLKLYDGEGHGFSPKARRSEISDVTGFFDKYGGVRYNG